VAKPKQTAQTEKKQTGRKPLKARAVTALSGVIDSPERGYKQERA
jgi:hypothetical protein